MSKCTAPVQGHRSAAARANCPACGSGNGGYSGASGSSFSYGGGSGFSPGGRPSGGGLSRPRWSRSGSTVYYTPAQVVSLTPIREAVEKQAAAKPGLRDCFLCHAWDDRQGAAKELHDLLEAAGVKAGLIQSPSKLLALAVAVPLPSAPLCRASRSACRSGLIETPPVATGSTPLFGDFP